MQENCPLWLGVKPNGWSICQISKLPGDSYQIPWRISFRSRSWQRSRRCKDVLWCPRNNPSAPGLRCGTRTRIVLQRNLLNILNVLRYVVLKFETFREDKGTDWLMKRKRLYLCQLWIPRPTTGLPSHCQMTSSVSRSLCWARPKWSQSSRRSTSFSFCMVKSSTFKGYRFLN